MRWILAVLLTLATGCAGGAGDAGSADGRPPVVASFYPLQFVAARIGGDALSVRNLTPAGAEPHDVELTPSQVEAIQSAGLVVYLSGDFQPAVEQAVDQAK